MAQEHHDIMRTGGIGEPSLGGTLSALLAITSDAVIAFDGSGTILLANDEALRLLKPSPGWVVPPAGLVGADVRILFPPAIGVVPDAPFTHDALPFSIGGPTVRLMRSGPTGETVSLAVRCERVSAPGEVFLLVAHPDTEEGSADRERERLVEELSRANRRLAGTLDIVLGTLDSPSVGTLFERVLERLRETMDARGTTVYLAEHNGFHLRGTSASLVGLQVPRYLPSGRSLVELVTRTERPLCLRVLPPEGESLRKGHLVYRNVMDEQTRRIYEVRSSQLPPFTSFLAIPVRFGGQVIALIEVGWKNVRAIAREDVDLLDAVTSYLAVQLVGALSALRSQRREQLTARASALRDTLVAQRFEPDTTGPRQTLPASIAADLSCACVPLIESAQGDGELRTSVTLPTMGREAVLPADMLPEGAEPVVTFGPDDPLGEWLCDQGEPCLGVLVDGGTVDGERLRLLVLRPPDAEPFDEPELVYLRQVGETVRALSPGEQGYRRERRIAQALQSGMRSKLQQVPGLSAEGIYSSATESAFVGGDFYDLIGLPERKACVIMGDVSGKGVEAASVSAAVRTALGAYSWEGLSPARMVRLLNEFLLGFSRLETFATLFVGIIDLAKGTLTYCSAGHPPALLVRAQSDELLWLGVQSGVVGAFHDMTYRDGSVSCAEGDLLLLYTDGTTEARAADGAFFGEDGLRDAVMREREAGFEGLLDRLLATVDDFTNNSLDDDVAMVAVRFDEVAAGSLAHG